MMKRILALLLALVMVFALCACGGGGTATSNPPASDAPATEPGGEDEPSGDAYTGPNWEEIDAMDYDDASDAIYDYNLGEFYDAYQTAKEELDNVNLRTALMAVAEAKLLESGVFVPFIGDAGAYAMSRVAPRTVTTTSWGLDEDKWYTALVCNEFLTSEDRTNLTALWGESENAEQYLAAAKEYLAGKGYTLTDTWNMLSGYELVTWDVIATSMTSDSYFIACTYSGLLEYDAKNEQQFALAESYDVSDDGTVYTFKIRKGVKWVDQQGREIGDVTANDWVSSMMHVADNNDALGYLMTSTDGCGILNYDEYLAGECSFDEVGVKAIDDYTLQYTLVNKFPAFASMMGYGCFAPLNAQFYKSQGGTFGAEGDEYTAGNYGTSPATIAYCGPYLISNFTAKNVTSYVANPSYWNADAVNVHNVNFYYNDGTDAMRPYNDAVAGTVASCSLTANALKQAQQDKPDGQDKTYFDLYHYTSTNSATTFCGWLNLNRGTWANFNDATKGVSPQTEEMQARTRSAMNNQHFRLAMAYGIDRGAYNAQSRGEDLKLAALKNSYITGAFAQLSADTTVEIGGESKTYPAGTYYGVILQDQLTADGYPIKVWDPSLDDGVGSGDGFDGWYNAANAASELDKAIAELAQVGVDISAENPIYIDYPYTSSSEVATNQANALKQSLEASLGGKVIVNLIAFETQTDENYADYRFGTGNEANYDLQSNSGWGPDYGDPQTFLDTIQPGGYMCKNLGIY